MWLFVYVLSSLVVGGEFESYSRKVLTLLLLLPSHLCENTMKMNNYGYEPMSEKEYF